MSGCHCPAWGTPGGASLALWGLVLNFWDVLGNTVALGLHHLEVCITSSSPLPWAVCDLTFSISLGSLIYCLVHRFGVSIALEVFDASGSPSLW